MGSSVHLLESKLRVCTWPCVGDSSFSRRRRPCCVVSVLCHVQLQQGIQGILVLDARDGSPARLAGVHGTRRDQSGRLVLGDIISAFNGKKVK